MTTTLVKIEVSVPVTTPSMLSTSLLTRFIISPVFVLVKKETGILCKCVTRLVRRSRMMPSPTIELRYPCTMPMPAATNAASNTSPTSVASARTSRLGIAESMMRAVINPGANPMVEAATMQNNTVACWRQYGANSAPILFQSTRR